MERGEHSAADCPDSTTISLFWAKSNAGGQPHSLIAHLLDSAAVAELLWSRYLSRKVRRQLDRASQGRGRDLLVLLVAWHDLGKATPAFQSKRPDLIAALPLPIGVRSGFDAWPHSLASAVIAHDAFAEAEVGGFEWVLPLLAGHHGRITQSPIPRPSRTRWAHGGADWQIHQRKIASVVADRTGVELRGWHLSTPPRGVQLALSGLVTMVDWIASSDLFPGVGLHDLTIEQARTRAEHAWARLGLDGGWRESDLLRGGAGFAPRFGCQPRPLQQLAMTAVMETPAPGLTIIEAPMGEGKTEAAAAACELIAASTGCSGVTFAMPTQGTTDAMYARVCKWLDAVSPELPVSLLHGKAMLNELWRHQLEQRHLADLHGETDSFGMSDPFGPAEDTYALSFTLGRHRGLLAHFLVATVDQVLWAATRTRFVNLRHAGIANHVVIVDEVHSYDVHMGVFLDELLRWCARADVPVVLMSATLPPHLRQQLVDAWRQGAGLPPALSPIPSGYPSILTALSDGQLNESSCAQFRPDTQVAVSIFDADPADCSAIAAALASEVQEGGCALAILNTVSRAQAVYSDLKARGVDAILLHGRLTAAERAARTKRTLDLLGPTGRRPERLVVVATQIAEQSFDVDADVLYSDIAPMDLLLQRVGRLHRHEVHAEDRPVRHRVARLVVTGLTIGRGVPAWAPAFAEAADSEPSSRTNAHRTVYRPLPLLASASVVKDQPTWSIPGDVPGLVADAYASSWSGPVAWRPLAAAAACHERAEDEARKSRAATYRLDADPATQASDLWGLHTLASAERDDGFTPVVRDGDESVEVCLIGRNEDGYFTLGGRPLGPHGERALGDELAREVLADSVRLRWRPDLEGIRPLPDWAGHRLLGFAPVVILDAEGRGKAGSRAVRYDSDLGLVEW